jgi:hypothetical protein
MTVHPDATAQGPVVGVGIIKTGEIAPQPATTTGAVTKTQMIATAETGATPEAPAGATTLTMTPRIGIIIVRAPKITETGVPKNPDLYNAKNFKTFRPTNPEARLTTRIPKTQTGMLQAARKSQLVVRS